MNSNMKRSGNWLLARWIVKITLELFIVLQLFSIFSNNLTLITTLLLVKNIYTTTFLFSISLYFKFLLEFHYRYNVTSVERLFKQGGLILSPRRLNLTDIHFEMLLFLKVAILQDWKRLVILWFNEWHTEKFSNHNCFSLLSICLMITSSLA